MGQVIYIAEVQLEQKERPLRLAHVPGEQQPVIFGVHGAVAEHYGKAKGSFEPHATTLDYIVAAAGG